jgi:CheY-like chemotaxis protein
VSARILFVDDEPHVLAGYRRLLRHRFDVETAASGAEALARISASGRYAVVVSDMRMPEMDGVQFLARAQAVAPDSVRIALTGNANVDIAIDAVNEGTIFRFLRKPCPLEVLVRALEAGVAQYELIRAERVLLERTLQGSVHVLTEILSLVSPGAFSRALRVRRLVQHIVSRLRIADGWRFEVAAALSQLGCVTLTEETLASLDAGQRLSPEELQRVMLHPSVTCDLLESIPRLELVARMIARQHERCVASPLLDACRSDEEIVRFGACLLRVTIEFDRLLAHGTTQVAAIARMDASHEFPGPMLDALRELKVAPCPTQLKTVSVSRLEAGMIIDQDLRTQAGLLLVGRGQLVTSAVLARLANFSRCGAIEGTVRVLLPTVSHQRIRPLTSATSTDPGFLPTCGRRASPALSDAAPMEEIDAPKHQNPGQKMATSPDGSHA